MDVAKHLRELEELLLTDAVRKNRTLASSILADEFREFGSSGRSYTKSEILDLLESEPAAQLTLEDFEAFWLSETVVLVTYCSVREIARSSPSKALRSSLWVLRGGQWKMTFHQGTHIP